MRRCGEWNGGKLPGLEYRFLDHSFLVLVVLGASVHQPFYCSALALHTILCAMPYPTQCSLECSVIIIILAYAPSRIPEPPPDIVFFVFIFVRGIHPIGEILQ